MEGVRPPRVPPPGRTGRPAGVLVLLYPDADGLARVVLTERATRDGHHSGEVSFPGGAAEPDDVDITATALREAAEEIALDAVAAGLARRRPARPVLDPGQRLRGHAGPRRRAPPAGPRASPAEVARIVEPPVDRFLPGRPGRDRRADDPRLAAPLRRVRRRRALGVGRDRPDPEPARGRPGAAEHTVPVWRSVAP